MAAEAHGCTSEGSRVDSEAKAVSSHNAARQLSVASLVAMPGWLSASGLRDALVEQELVPTAVRQLERTRPKQPARVT